MKKLAIIFPGAGYGLDSPLLYYADFVFETNGYERVHMNYTDILGRKDLCLEDKRKMLQEYIWEQAKEIPFDQYDEIVFLSKSVGGIEAGILADKLDITVKQILLTPVEDAVQYISKDSMVVIGTNDNAYPVYKELCKEKEVKVLFVEGADHSLEIVNRPFESISALEKVMKSIEATLG